MSNEIHPAQVELARVFSSVRLMGPPFSERLVRLMVHLFSPEEAAVARHLPFYRPRPLERIARGVRRPPEEITPLLEAMGARRVIYQSENGYSLLPLIPGMFEYMLMNGADSDWHREYARQLIDLFSTGYMREYNANPTHAVRNLPVAAAIEGQSLVADPDLVAEMIERHSSMGVLTVCQCRQSKRFVGQECKRARPEDGCLMFGRFAETIVQKGNGRLVEKSEMREIVAERREKKLVFMTGNVGAGNPNGICTCCDCCCHGLESINHYQGMGLVAEPRFKAAVDEAACDHCGKCARACNTYAHAVAENRHSYDPAKCIGCGLCVVNCKEHALRMEANPAYRPPAEGFGRLGLRLLPASLLSGLKVAVARRGAKPSRPRLD